MKLKLTPKLPQLKTNLFQLNFVSQFETLVVIGIVILLNLIVFNFGLYRFDLTSDKRYSLSPATAQILSQLPDKVTVKVYISGQIPGKFAPLKNYVLTTLLTMQRLSHNKLKVLVYDPDQNEQKRQEAKDYNLPEVEFTIIENDQFQTKKGFFGLVINFTDRTDIIPVFDRIDTFEYEFIRRLLKITAPTEPKLYVFDPDNMLSKATRFRQQLNQTYQLVDINLNPDTNLDTQNTKAIFIYNPQQSLTDDQIKVLQKWQSNNRHLIVFVDGLSLDDQFIPQFNFDKHQKLLQLFNLSMPSKLLLAPRGEVISFTAPNIPFPIFQYYNFWLKVKSTDVPTQIAFKNDLIGTVFPWVSYFDYDSNQSNITPLLTFTQINTLDCPCSIQPGSFEFKPDQTQSATSMVLINNNDKTKALVLADADFVDDNMIRRYPQNLKLGLDAIDLLAFDDRLINLRAKTIQNRSLKDLTPSQKQYYKILMLTLPVITLLNLAALIYLINRWHSKKLAWD